MQQVRKFLVLDKQLKLICFNAVELIIHMYLISRMTNRLDEQHHYFGRENYQLSPFIKPYVQLGCGLYYIYVIKERIREYLISYKPLSLVSGVVVTYQFLCLANLISVTDAQSEILFMSLISFKFLRMVCINWQMINIILQRIEEAGSIDQKLQHLPRKQRKIKSSSDSEVTTGNLDTRESSSMGSVDINQRVKRAPIQPKFTVQMPVFDIKVKITAQTLFFTVQDYKEFERELSTYDLSRELAIHVRLFVAQEMMRQAKKLNLKDKELFFRRLIIDFSTQLLFS